MNLAELFVEVKETGIDAVTNSLKQLTAEGKKAETAAGNVSKSLDKVGDVKTPLNSAADAAKNFGSATQTAFTTFSEHSKKAEASGDGIANAFGKLSFISPQMGVIGEGLQGIANKAMNTFNSVQAAVNAFTSATTAGTGLTGSNTLLTGSLVAHASKTTASTTATAAFSAQTTKTAKDALATGNALNKESEAYRRLAKDAYDAARAQGATPTQARAARNIATKVANTDAGVQEMDRLAGAARGVAMAATEAEAGIGLMGMAAAGVAAGTVAFLAVQAAMLAIGLAVSETADKLNDFSKETNLSTERLSVLDLVAKMAGKGVEDLTSSADKLGMKLAKQDEESGKAIKALDELGISTKDAAGETKSMLKLQEEIVLAVDKAGNSSKAQGAAVMLLGAEYYKLKTIIKDTTNTSELYDYMSKVGSITTTKLAEDSGKLQDKIDLLKNAFTGMGKSIASAVMPALNSIVDAIAKIATKAAELIKRYTGQDATFNNKEAIAATYDEENKAKNRLKLNEGRFGPSVERERKQDLATLAQIAQKRRELQDAGLLLAREQEKTKEETINGKKGEGNNPAGKPTDHSAEIAKQKSLMEQMVGLEHDQNLEYLKLNGYDETRIKLQEQGLKIIDQLTGKEKEKAKEILNNLLAQYDTNKAMSDEQKAAAELLKTEKEIRAEREKSLKVVDDLFRKASETIAKERDAFNNRNQSAEQRNASAKITSVTSGYDSQEIATQDRIDRMDKKDPNYERNKKSAEQEIALIRQRRAESKASMQELMDDASKAEKSVDEGIMRGLTKAIDEIPSLAEGISGLVTATSKGLQDGLFNLFTTGEFNVKSFFKMIIDQMLQLVIQIGIVKPLMESFKASMSGGESGGSIFSAIGTGIKAIFSANGNVFQNGSLMKFANGGVVTSPTAFPMKGGTGVMGEAGPEAVMPLVRSANGKLGVQASGGSSGGQTFVVNVTVNGGKNAQETGDVVSNAVMNAMRGLAKEEIIKARRVGGSLNPI